jgi:hypothetical protein
MSITIYGVMHARRSHAIDHGDNNALICWLKSLVRDEQVTGVDA